MIIKYYELNKINFKKNNFFLFYGKNEGHQNEIIEQYFTGKFEGQITRYDENEFINNNQLIVTEMMNKSLFENNKLIIISRVSDKIFRVIDDIINKDLSDIKILLKCGMLEKRSKIRNLFEKNNNLVIIPFYEDNERSLLPIVNNFLAKNKINLARESINLLINRSSGNRENLKTELNKILNFSFSHKIISFEDVQKLSNLAENIDVNHLVNCYLSKNSKKIAKTLNENNYSDEDCILIVRTILSKSKRLLGIIEKYEQNKDLDQVILQTKPPIFWKDKDIMKKQAKSWNSEDLKENIYKINEIEVLIKNNSNNSLNILSDFILN